MLRASRILVPVNGNLTDDEMIALACHVAKRTKARVYAIYVIEVKRTLPVDAELAAEAAKGEAILDHAERVAEELGQDLDTELLQAREVGPTIVDEAAERNIDLVIVGVTYKKKWGEFDLGRTVQYVLKRAPCEVWVCREPGLGKT